MKERAFLEKLGAYITRRREDLGLDLRAFAAHSKIPLTTLHSIEHGRSPLSLWTLFKLADAFGEHLSTFVEELQTWSRR